MLGIDLSNNNGAVNWAQAKAAGVDFAWVKATEGLTFNDSTLLQNLQGARAHGIAVGAYHFARPDEHGPEVEADHFLSIYRPHPGDLLPVLDFETHASLSAARMTAWAKRWLELVEAGLHVEAVIYTYPYFLHDNLDVGALKGRKLWYADYTGTPGKFAYASFARGMNVVAQQYSSHGHVRGVSGRVDVNHARSLGPILQVKPRRKPKRAGALPGPSPKPRWFFSAVREFLRRRKKK